MWYHKLVGLGAKLKKLILVTTHITLILVKTWILFPTSAGIKLTLHATFNQHLWSWIFFCHYLICFVKLDELFSKHADVFLQVERKSSKLQFSCSESVFEIHCCTKIGNRLITQVEFKHNDGNYNFPSILLPSPPFFQFFWEEEGPFGGRGTVGWNGWLCNFMLK